MLPKEKHLSGQKGISIILTLLILSGVLATSLGVVTLMIQQIKLAGTLADSTVSLYAAEAGIERVLYEDRYGVYDPAYPIVNFKIVNLPPELKNISVGAGTYTVYEKTAEDTEKPGKMAVTYKSWGEYKGNRRAIEVNFSVAIPIP